MSTPQKIPPRDQDFFLLNGYLVTPGRLSLGMIADLLEVLDQPQMDPDTRPWLLLLEKN